MDILATVNGVPYRLSATNCNRDRRFASMKVQVEGKGRGAMLDAPYAPTLNHASAATRSVEQLLNLALTYNGVSIGWGVDFGLMDWAVPGGTWDFQGSYIGAVLDIASAAGAIVQPTGPMQPCASCRAIRPRRGTGTRSRQISSCPPLRCLSWAFSW